LSKHDHLSRLSGVNEMPCAATAIFVHQQFVTSRVNLIYKCKLQFRDEETEKLLVKQIGAVRQNRVVSAAS
jgi:hypothetical protein